MKYTKTFIAAALTAAISSAAFGDGHEVKVIGVSIPAATHGWAGGMNFHAAETVERLEEVYPGLDFVLATASDPGKQVNDIEDMVATRNIDALVVLPFESDPLTPPVQAVADSDDSFTVMQDFLSKYPNIDAVWASDDDMAIGVLAAIEAAGREDIQFVLGENAADFYYPDSPF